MGSKTLGTLSFGLSLKQTHKKEKKQRLTGNQIYSIIEALKLLIPPSQSM
jgi:hypothetical protein